MADRSRTAPDSPTISVVMPIYNEGWMARDSITSVLDQQVLRHRFELVVVDDGSTDDTLEVLLSLGDTRLRILQQENRGPGAARNTGAEVAQGRLLTFLDGDDRARSGWLAAHIRNLSEPDVVASCIGLRREIDGNRADVILPHDLGPAFYDYRGLFVTGGTFAVPREVFREVGGFDERLRFGENTELALRLTAFAHKKSGRIVSTMEALVEQYWESGRSYPPATLAQAAELVMSVHGEQLRRDRRILANYLTIAGTNRIQLDDLIQGRRHLRQAWALLPFEAKRLARLLIATVPCLRTGVWS